MSVRVATTANITLSSATITVDGVTLADNDLILVKNQNTGTQNGIYVVSTSGSWVRSTLMSAGNDANGVPTPLAFTGAPQQMEIQPPDS